MFCVRCGQEGAVAEGLCAPCFTETQTLVTWPDRVRVETCALCGARRKRGTWGAPEADLDRVVAEEVRAAVQPDRRVEHWDLAMQGGERDPANHAYDLLVEGVASGVPFEARGPIVVHLQRGTCTRCGRRTGGYYESILQLRGEERRIPEAQRRDAEAVIDRGLRGLTEAGDHDSFLVKAVEVHGGADLYLGTVHAGRLLARALANEMGATLKESASLVGRNADGIDMYRVTILARLPRARAGDLAGLEGRLHQVVSVGPKQAVLLDLDTHARQPVGRGAIGKVQVVPPEAVREAVVVSESEGELQVLDPVTLATEVVLRPPGFPHGLGQVQVARWEDRLWLLPVRDKAAPPAGEGAAHTRGA